MEGKNATRLTEGGGIDQLAQHKEHEIIAREAWPIKLDSVPKNQQSWKDEIW